MQIKTFFKLVGALAYLFGKVKASEDSGHVVVVAFWLGRYWVLAETHLTSRAPDLLRADPRSAVAHPTSESTADNRPTKSATSG